MDQQQNITFYPDPDIEFRAVHYNSEEYFSLELGDEFIDESDTMTDEEIKNWAEENGHLDKESGFIDEDGFIYYDDLRERKKWDEEDYPGKSSYPCGRAYEWFIHQQILFPDGLKITLFDGEYPGNDTKSVIIDDYDSLKQLQDFLLKQDIKANFIFDFDL